METIIEVVGAEELLGCENDKGDCEDSTWVVMECNSKDDEKMGKVEKGIKMGMGKDTTDVPLLEVII